MLVKLKQGEVVPADILILDSNEKIFNIDQALINGRTEP